MTERNLFLSLLEISTPEEQAAYLDAQCGNDTGLKAEVESLLRAFQECDDFLETPLFPVETAASEDTQTLVTTSGDSANIVVNNFPNEHPLSATVRFAPYLESSENSDSLGQLPGYEILEVLGEGGMGVVFRVEDLKLKRVVALKMMAPEFAVNATARKRFLREAQTAAAINHPRVVTIHAIGEFKLPYLVMEYVQGQPLNEKIEKEGTLPEDEVLRIGSQIAQGLGAAHEQGLIHRDVKPANILLENGVERVKLTDFGLARAIDDVSVTRTGQISGTPQFMSPEQTEGENIDHRADLFSLGCVLYTMCTGRSPFRAANTIAVIKRINEDTPRPIREVNPEISHELTTIISRLLDKKPGKRYQSAFEVQDALTKLMQKRLNSSEVVADSSTPLSSRIPRKLWWMGILVLMIGLLGAAQATGRIDFAGTIIRLARGEATLVVEINDPDISVKLNGEDLVFTGAGPKEIRITPGEYELNASKDGKPIQTEIFTLTRGGRQQIRIQWEPARKILPTNVPPHTPEIKPLQRVALTAPRPVRNLDTGTEINFPPAKFPPVAATFPFSVEQAKVFQERTAKQCQQPVSVKNSVGMEFRLIPSGIFPIGIGSRKLVDLKENDQHLLGPVPGLGLRRIFNKFQFNSRFQHQVRLTHPYYLSSCEVTQKQYQQVMNENPSYYQPANEELELAAETIVENHPVENVTWLNAVKFCNRLSELEQLTPCYRITNDLVTLVPGNGYRLPTSAEWEFACRAGSPGRWYATEKADLVSIAWFRFSKGEEERLSHSQPVGKLLPNAFGIFDMLGNVGEWVWDTYIPHEEEQAEEVNPGGITQNLAEALPTHRGGHFLMHGHYLHPGMRYHGTLLKNSDGVQGFRVVCMKGLIEPPKSTP